MDADHTIIWTFSDAGPQTRFLAGELTSRRDDWRAKRGAIVAVYLGSPLDWQTRIVRMLRSADANFPCVVAKPGDEAALGNWLFAAAHPPMPGLCLAARSRRILLRGPAHPTTLEEILRYDAGEKSPATQPADRIR
jgi:hypothetical protein